MTGLVKSRPLGSAVDTCSADWFAVDLYTTDGWSFLHAFHEPPAQAKKRVEALDMHDNVQFRYRLATAEEIESETAR